MRLSILCALFFSLISIQAAMADGVAYSGPASAAIALVGLSKRGYPNLSPKSKSDTEAIAKLTKILSSTISTSVGLDIGTSSVFPLQGVERYIRTCGYQSNYMKFQGSRLCPAGYADGFIPSFGWIYAGTKGPTGECLLIGWYNHDSVKDIYKRMGGSWVTLVGCQRNPYSKGCPVTLAVSDPSTGRQSWLYFDEMHSGFLQNIDKAGRNTTLQQNANGMYKVSSGVNGAGIGVLEGAVIFRLAP